METQEMTQEQVKGVVPVEVGFVLTGSDLISLFRSSYTEYLDGHWGEFSFSQSGFDGYEVKYHPRLVAIEDAIRRCPADVWQYQQPEVEKIKADVEEWMLEKMVHHLKSKAMNQYDHDREQRELLAVWAFFLHQMFGREIDFTTEYQGRERLMRWEDERQGQCGKFDGYDAAVVARFAKVGTFERRDQPVFVTKDGRVLEIPAYALDHDAAGSPEYAAWEASEFKSLVEAIFKGSATTIGVLGGIAKLASEAK